MDALADEFTVLAWDAPGHYADAVAAWLDAVGIERPHVLGLSWGSSVALEFYRRHAQVPASLILASAYAGWAGSLSAEETAARLEGILAAADLPLEEMLWAWPGIDTWPRLVLS